MNRKPMNNYFPVYWDPKIIEATQKTKLFDLIPRFNEVNPIKKTWLQKFREWWL